RRFLVFVEADAGARVRDKAGRLRRRRDAAANRRRRLSMEPIAAAQLERRQRRGERNAEPECLAVGVERALAGLLELRRAQFEIELVVLRDVETAAPEQLVGLTERGLERLRRDESLVAEHDERSQREALVGLRRGGRGEREHEQGGESRPH